MVVIKQSTLLPMSNHQKVPDPFHASLLQKYPQPANSGEGMTTFLSFSACHNKQTSSNFHGDNFLDHSIFDSEREQTPAAMMQMKLEKSMDDRMWVTSMTKHVMEINKHLQSYLLDMMQSRLLHPQETNSSETKKRRKLKTKSPGLLEEQSQSTG